MKPSVNIDRIKHDLEVINAFNSTPGEGITRLTFSPEYMGAYQYFVDELKKIGAEVSVRVGGCLRGRLKGTDPSSSAVMSGSHIDTVLNGGQFDGQAGSVAALEAARVIVENNIPHSRPIDIVVFPEEEGTRFGTAMAASSVWSGLTEAEELYQSEDNNGISYLRAMEQAGVQVEDSASLKPEAVKAMLELHIEQSVTLEKEGLSVGIIEAIAGTRLLDVTINGVANHAGGTPMKYRNDALQGAVRLIAAVEQAAENEAGPHTVATCGTISAKPGAINVIPGQAELTFDIRDPDSDNLEKMVANVKRLADDICKRRDLTAEISRRFAVQPTKIAPDMVVRLYDHAMNRGIPTKRMVSGALHDSCKLASITDIGMIFVPSKDGRSHCPEEWTDFKDIENGANVLLDAITDLAQ